MAELTLYTHPQSRGRIARWMLEETGQPYRAEIVPYERAGGGAGGEAFRAINPMGKFPTLVHRGKVVTEAAAICAYLADTFPEAGLAPPPPERADYYRWLFFAAGPLEAAVVNHAMGWHDPSRERMLGYGSYQRTLDALEGWLTTRNWIAGPQFTAADVYVGAAVIWGLRFGTIEPRPAFAAYGARLGTRPAYRRANAADDAAAEAMEETG